MKKVISLLCLCAMIMALITIPVFAATGSCGATITYKLEDGVLTISGTGNTEKYQRNPDNDSASTPWWKDRNSIKSVIVEEGVTTLDNYLFYKCENMESITLPESLQRIEARTFAGCKSLKSITFPVGLQYIGFGAFENAGLTEITFKGACPKVSSTVPFSGVAATVYYNGDAAFKSTEFGGSLTWEVKQFIDVSADPDPAEGVDMTGATAQGDCGDGVKYAFKDGILLITGQGGMRKFVRNPDLDIPDTPWWDWRGDIKQVIIGKGVTSVENYAFYKCENLESVTLPATITGIYYGAFKECKALKELTLPRYVLTLGSQAFANSGLEKITLEGSKPADIGDLMTDGLTGVLYYPCSDGDVSMTDIKIYGGKMTWAKTHKYEGGKCTVCGIAEGSDAPIVPVTDDEGVESKADPLSILTIMNIVLSVIAVAAIDLSFVIVLRTTKKKRSNPRDTRRNCL